MLYKTRGIVLRAIPYKETYYIIYMYTEAFGRVSYLVSRGKGKKSGVMRSLFIPLSVLELEVEHLNRREMQRIKEARLCLGANEWNGNPVKSVLALFLSEVLFRFLYDSIQVLEGADEGIANFHLVFLLHLLYYLGIYPNTEHRREGLYFDMLNGIFTDQMPTHPHYLRPDETRVLVRLLKMSYENMSLYAFSRHDRVRIIERIFEYYRLHIPGFQEIKSLSVLQSLFD